MLPRGSTIGILGGGQLGRMMALSAAGLGYRCVGYAPDGDSVLEPVCCAFTRAPWDDADALARFAADCDVVTWEFENVPVDAAAAMPRIAPHPRALETAQDRLNEKRFATSQGGRPAPYAAVDSPADLAAAIETIGTPGILKTRRDGYDGKGQWRIMTPEDAAALDLPDTPLIYEGFVTFDAEFSVILVRGQDGEVRFWDSPLNSHRDGILDTSVLPAGDIVAAQAAEARALAGRLAEALEYVGVLTCEFFATPQGPVFNEMAPRVHNSGHWTIEGAATSQFENHIRAVAGLPLGDTRTVAGKVTMTNLIGADILAAAARLAEPGTHLHDYGKAEVREGRKMGHLTRLEP